VNVTITSFVSSKAISSKLWTSRIKVSGGGGGLMFDFTPDFAVMLREYMSTGRHINVVSVQRSKCVKVSAAFVRLRIAILVKPLQSCIQIFKYVIRRNFI